MTVTQARGRADSYRPGTTINEWHSEDPSFWQSTGSKVAARNLWVFVPALMLAFVVWQVWSVTVVQLSKVGFTFSESQKFWLTGDQGVARLVHGE